MPNALVRDNDVVSVEASFGNLICNSATAKRGKHHLLVQLSKFVFIAKLTTGMPYFLFEPDGQRNAMLDISGIGSHKADMFDVSKNRLKMVNIQNCLKNKRPHKRVTAIKRSGWFKPQIGIYNQSQISTPRYSTAL